MNEVHVPLDPCFFMLVVILKKETFPFTKNKLIKPCINVVYVQYVYGCFRRMQDRKSQDKRSQLTFFDKKVTICNIKKSASILIIYNKNFIGQKSTFLNICHFYWCTN